MAGLPALNEDQMKLVQDLEIEMMSDMYTRMTNSCHKKCIPTKYKDSEIGKGEAVCIDRCVAKYWEIHERVGKKLQKMSTQDEEALKKIAAEQGLVK
ncbi:mitochondrial import inner membrane translocase subunit Tim10-like [Homarus americanus]|uniref:mitochondrial import inner membrane translocase subunit Tim10-like n=1 Tax=Homarus americanus TaxID=6706 RepID=UPI001C4398D4|nr:mitochondrial import inner membrane translocase subunit Tim10-like [Homarus americanus]